MIKELELIAVESYVCWKPATPSLLQSIIDDTKYRQKIAISHGHGNTGRSSKPIVQPGYEDIIDQLQFALLVLRFLEDYPAEVEVPAKATPSVS